MYWAIDLGEEDKDYILRILENSGIIIPDDWTIHLDHITLCHEKSVTPEQWTAVDRIMENFSLSEIRFGVFAYDMNDSVLAVRVDVKSMNKYAHITVAVAPGHKPVESNELSDWKRMAFKTFSGIVCKHL